MSPLRKAIRKPISMALFSGIFVFLLIIVLRSGGHIESLELIAYDWFIRLTPKVSDGNPKITLIKISESDISALGRWPLTDETLARAMEILLKAKPRAIGLDIYRDILIPPGSEELNRIVAENPHIVGVMKFGVNGVLPQAIIQNTEQVGFNDILVDQGGIVRRALLFLDDGENVYDSFALRLALLYLQAEGITPQADTANPNYIRLGDTTIKPLETNEGGYIQADARGYQFLIDYKNTDSSFRAFSFSDLLSGKIPTDAVRNKIIIIGVDAQSVKDFFYTPLSRGFEADQQIIGVVLHGHIVSQLLRFALDGTRPIYSLTEGEEYFWILLWSLIGCAIGIRTRSVLQFSLLSGGGLALLFLIAYFAFLARVWIPLFPPVLSYFISFVVVMAYMSNQEKKKRALLMQLFSQHVSKEIAEMIWQQRDQLLSNGRLSSQKMIDSVFFLDLKGFTAMSEKMDPKDLLDWLNSYMEAMAGLIMEHGGVVDNYVGDSIKADFGIPLPRSTEEEVRSDAVNAVICALAMEKEIKRLNSIWSEKGFPAMGMRVGIFTGPVVAGLLGSAQRLKYTTIGDTVNIASRLESYDKEIGKDTVCRIFIGETTLGYLDFRFITERIGEVSLKGKEESIVIYQVLGEKTPCYHEISQEEIK
jgi:adenylate cyclase